MLRFFSLSAVFCAFLLIYDVIYKSAVQIVLPQIPSSLIFSTTPSSFNFC